MVEYRSSVITGTGKYIPEDVVTNSDLEHDVYHPDGTKVETSHRERLVKFESISTISERRYASQDQVASDLGYLASLPALESSGIDREMLDYIIFAQNFGDIDPKYMRTDLVPPLSTRLKRMLEIRNRKTETLDLPFGCPGWVQGLIVAHRFFAGGFGKSALIPGADTLSRVKDVDRDGPLYADGGGAGVLEYLLTDKPVGIRGFAFDCGDSREKVRGKTISPSQIMCMKPTYGPDKNGRLFFKMETGNDVYIYAKRHVPTTIQESIKNSEKDLKDFKKFFLHQANGKMDDEMFMETLRLYGVPFRREENDGDVFFYVPRRALEEKLHQEVVSDIISVAGSKEEYELHDITRFMLPMSISKLGNTSIATVPTLLDMVLRGEIDGHRLKEGDNIILAAIGAGGPNINSIVYTLSGVEFANVRVPQEWRFAA